MNRLVTVLASSLLLMACNKVTVEQRMTEAESALSDGNYKRAIIQLKSAVQDSPNDVRPRIELAKIYFDVGDMVSAIATFDKALTQRANINDFAQPYFLALYSMADLDIFEVTLEEFKDDLKGSQRTSVELIAAVISGRSKSEEMVAKHLSLALETASPDDLERIKDTEFVIKHFLLSDDVEKKSTLYALTEKYPTDWLLRSLIAEIQQAIGDFDLAAQSYQDLLSLKPYFAQLNLKIAEVLLMARNYSEAEKYIDKILSISSTNPLANQQKALIALSRNNFDDAAKYIEIAINQNLVTPTAIYVAGISHFQIGNYEQALSYLEKIVGALPPSHPGLQMYIAAKLSAGDSLSAYKMYEKYPSLISSNNRLATKAASALLFSGEKGEAAAILDRVNAETFESSEDKQQLGLLKLSAGDKAAMSLVESSSKQIISEANENDSYKSKILLIGIKASNGEIEEARNIIAEWISDDPKNIDNYLISSEFESFLGNTEALDAIYEKIKWLSPSNPQALRYYASKDLQEQNFDDALKAYTSLLKRYPNDEVVLAGATIAASNTVQTRAAYQNIVQILKESGTATPLTFLHASYLQGDYKNVISLSRTSVFDYNTQPKADYLVASSYLELDQPLAAIDALRRNIKAGWITEQVLEVFVEAKMEAEGNRSALRILNNSPDVLKQSNRIKLLRAHVLVNDGQYDAALKVLTSLPAEIQNSARAKQIFGRATAAKNDFVTALPALKEAYKSLGTLKSAQLLYKALKETGDIDAGLTVLEEMAQRTPGYDNADLFYISELSKVDAKKAVAEYQSLLKAKPKHWQAMNNLAWLLLQQGQVDEANRWIMKALSLQPSNNALLDTKNKIESAIKQ
ncbi:tetratricopeptide repeat protein [Aestuariibacter sp. A3R04]|uniref:tetratricopeptide repeat protein n=1 Tax=Aestuariibacter sp. A3R04 TaxID=2841571 RepID=UPI001C0A00D9|nr:tetratricopeptide repeat protein [Aestuariibacter sp. A3R04]MBU3021764.1 tetratricopeptide repeat protein [Aestuariibacter sp. A3R04]